tara:strand:+ start:1542 stop:2270 length:729 start_codon:yes stop_codon:yes gene_type:complete
MIKLINGDCLEKIKDLSDNSIDLVITDLPYGLGHSKLKWDTPIDLNIMWEQLWRVTKPNSPIFMFADMIFASKLISSQPKYFKYEIVWEKTKSTTPMLSFKRMGKATEYILVFYKKQPKYLAKDFHKVVRSKNNTVMGGLGQTYIENKRVKSKYYEPKLPLNIFKCPNIDGHHKKIKGLTEKPVEVIEHILKYYAEKGDTCLDICMGSGSTGEACKNRGVNFIGIELNNNHFKICKDRLYDV